METTSMMLDHAMTARAAAAASCVLLKNMQSTLPLLAEDGGAVRLAVFGAGQIATAFCSAGMTPWRTVSYLDALSAAPEVMVDGLLSHKYRTWALSHPDGEEMPVESFCMEEYAMQNDAALIVITRAAGSKQLQMTQQERALCRAVNAAFSRVALILNTPGYLELCGEALCCGAILFAGIAGQEAGGALADILTAKAVPSGHLAHSWPMDAASFEEACRQQDVFTGYRYFDSFNVPIRYPFGYGLSYGKAELGEVSVAVDGSEVIVCACVENTGSVYPVQELVQVYVSHEAQDESPVYRLSCFEKTDLLRPGETQTLRLRFPLTELALFHEDASGFVLEAGYYDIRIGTSCRASMIAGSVRAARSAIVQAVSPLKMPPSLSRSRQGVAPFTYPGEEAELAAARRHAIRLSDRNLPRISRRKGRPFAGCRADGNEYTLADVKAGRCNVFQLAACMDEQSLRELVYDFGAKESAVPGALGASSALERYGIAPMTIAAGGDGLQLTRDLPQEEDGSARHQYCTAFPMASLLACSFDLSLIRAVGRAIGQEMAQYGVQFWLAPCVSVQRSPLDAAFADCWSEDPVVCGRCARAMAEGVRPFGAAILWGTGSAEALSHSMLRDVYALSYEIASGACDACLLPAMTLGTEPVCEDSALVRSLVVDWRFGGMFLTDGERYLAEPTRITLEKSALRMLKVAAKYMK